MIVPSIHACVAKGESPFRLGDGMNMWDISYAPNVAYAHALAVENLLTTKSAHGEAMVSSCAEARLGAPRATPEEQCCQIDA